jgi:hypothetical protein
MSTNLTPTGSIERWSENPLLHPANFMRLTGHYERWMQGLMSVAMHQLEATQGWMRGNLEDFDRLAEARSPGALVQAEIEIFRRRSQEAAGAARKIADEFHRTFAEGSAFVVEAAAGDAKAPAPAAATPDTAADVQPVENATPGLEVTSTARSTKAKVTVSD